MRPELNKETELLLSCTWPAVDDRRAKKIQLLLDSGLDWDHLIKSASYHGIVPLLYLNLKNNVPEAVPPAVKKELQMRYLANARWSTMLTRELLRLLDIFETEGIPAIPFKGPILAQQIFGDVALRAFSDLDIIIQKQDVLRAKAILLKEGYRPDVLLNAFLEKSFLKSGCEYNLRHKSKNIMVEVHWQLAPSCYAVSFDFRSVWSRICKMTMESRSISILSPEDLLIVLCIHGAIHSWSQIKLVYDVAKMIDLHKDLDWKKVRSYARELHVERILLIGLKLTKDLLGTALPKDASDIIEKDPTATILASQVWKQLAKHPTGPSPLMNQASFWFMARERPWDRLSFAMFLPFEPNAADLSLVTLPVRLYLLYHLIRPIRLICQYGMNAGYQR